MNRAISCRREFTVLAFGCRVSFTMKTIKYCLLYKHERRFRRLRNPEILHDCLWVDLLLSVTLRLWMVCWPADCAEAYGDVKRHKRDRLHAKSRVLMEREYQSSETERLNAKN